MHEIFQEYEHAYRSIVVSRIYTLMTWLEHAYQSMLSYSSICLDKFFFSFLTYRFDHKNQLKYYTVRFLIEKGSLPHLYLIYEVLWIQFKLLKHLIFRNIGSSNL
jgi:hypothetical protein